MAEKFGGFSETFIDKPKNKEKTRESKEGRVFDIVFERRFKGKNKTVEYFNSDPTLQRKRAVLERGSQINPEDNKYYKVEVIKDTKPEDPQKGELVVRIIEAVRPPEKVERKKGDVIKDLVFKDNDGIIEAIDPVTGRDLLLKGVDIRLLKDGYRYSAKITEILEGYDVVSLIPDSGKPMAETSEAAKVERKSGDIIDNVIFELNSDRGYYFAIDPKTGKELILLGSDQSKIKQNFSYSVKIINDAKEFYQVRIVDGSEKSIKAQRPEREPGDIIENIVFEYNDNKADYEAKDPVTGKKLILSLNLTNRDTKAGVPYRVKVYSTNKDFDFVDISEDQPRLESKVLEKRKKGDIIKGVVFNIDPSDPIYYAGTDPETGRLLVLRFAEKDKVALDVPYDVKFLEDIDDSSGFVVLAQQSESQKDESRVRPEDFDRISSQKSELPTKDREAQFHRAARLRNSVHFRVMMQIVRRDPQVYEEMLQVLKRQEEFKKNLAERGEHHRDFSALFSAIHLNQRAALLLDQAIDRTTEAESEWVKEQIREGANYVHELVVGTGVHSGVYRQERLMYIPDDPGLAIDRSHKLGGQFAQSGGDAHGLNSRNRPENRRLPHLPGTEGSLNTQGTRAVVQPSDASGKVYVTNWDMAQPVRANQFLIGRNAIDLELRNVEKISDGQEGQGILKVTAIDMRTGEEFFIRTDRLILTTGLDQEQYGLDESQGATKEFLEASQAAIKAGQRARIYRSSELLAQQADRTNPFPQQGIEEVISWGKGDSWKVAIGSLLGHEGQVGKTVTQLDRVKKVIAIGQEYLTKEKFLECERARYATLGLEFPREKVERYYYRIEPYKGRALYLEESDNGDPIVVAEIEDQGGNKSIKRFTIGENAVGMAAAGFKDATDEVLKGIGKTEITDRLEIIERQDEILKNVGTTIEFAGAQSYDIQSVQILSYDPRAKRSRVEISFSTTGRKSVYNFGVDGERENAFVKEVILENSASKLVKLARPLPPNLEEIRVEGFKDPVAMQYEALPIQRVGPAARLRLTENEKRQSPVLEQIPENTASIFRYTDYVAAVAKMNAEQDIENGFDKPAGLSLLESEKKRVSLPSISRKRTRGGFAASGFELSADRNTAERYLPMGANVKDLLNFVIGEKAAAYVFPSDLESISFNVTRTESAEGIIDFKISSTPKLPTEYNSFFADIFKDPLMQRMVRQFTDGNISTNSKREVDITMPLLDTPQGERVAYVGRIDYSVPIRSRK